MSHLPRNLPGRPRGIYTNRTLNLRSIKAIGYDMDYTLVHYHVEAWEGHAYEHTRQKLLERGWPVEQLEFDPKAAMRGFQKPMAVSVPFQRHREKSDRPQGAAAGAPLPDRAKQRTPR